MHKWSIAKQIDEHSLLEKQVIVCRNNNQPKEVHVFFTFLRFKKILIRRHSNLLWHELLIFCTINQTNDTVKVQNICYCICLVIYLLRKQRLSLSNKKTVMIYLLQLVLQLVHYHYMIKKKFHYKIEENQPIRQNFFCRFPILY